MISSIIVGIIGIASTLVAWFYNPKRAIYAELDAIYEELEKWYVRRDTALQNNDSDSLTICTNAILKLHSRKDNLLLRLR